MGSTLLGVPALAGNGTSPRAAGEESERRSLVEQRSSP